MAGVREASAGERVEDEEGNNPFGGGQLLCVGPAPLLLALLQLCCLFPLAYKDGHDSINSFPWFQSPLQSVARILRLSGAWWFPLVAYMGPLGLQKMSP